MDLVHLAGKTVVDLADRAEEVVDIVVVNAPSWTVGCFAVEGVLAGVVLRLSYGFGEVLLIDFGRDELQQ